MIYYSDVILDVIYKVCEKFNFKSGKDSHFISISR